MTSTTAASTAVREAASDDADAPPSAADPGDVPGAPRRRPARFWQGSTTAAPGPDPDAPAVSWEGADDALREQVRDHAAALGITLRQGVPGAAAVIIDGAALEHGSPAPAADGAPLLVVTAEPEIPVTLWRRALAIGARSVLPLPSASEELLSQLSVLSRPRAAALRIGVVGGCGGAGASSFAARLAGAALRSGSPSGREAVTLVDADPLGGGLDLLVEAPQREGIGWAEASRLGPDDGEALREGLPRVDGVHLLVAGAGPGPEAADVPRVLAALSPLGGTVVVDLATSLVPAAAGHLDHLLVVVPSTDPAVRAAARRLHAWQLPAGLAQAVVRRIGPLAPPEVSEDLALALGGAFRDSARGTVPLLDVRRGGADRTARTLLAALRDGVRR